MSFCALWFVFMVSGEAFKFTPAVERLDGYAKRLELQEMDPFQNLRFRSVGPSNMGGRVVDLLGFPRFPNTYYAAYASGGLWRSDDRGDTWRPLFDQMSAITIGDIAARPENPDEIWVGTGEANSSRSSYAGTGLYHSTDGGKSWSYAGLAETQHISRILLHPTQRDTLFVAAVGHLYSPNSERGFFKSTDGGKSWRKTLYIDERTGLSDLAMDPSNPDRLYAASWQRERSAWNFVEAGQGSGFFISEDGGERWFQVTNGLPTGENVGRIGIGVSESHPETLYVCLDNQLPNPNPLPDGRPLTASKLLEMSKDQFLALSDEVIQEFLEGNDFHPEIKAKQVREQLISGELQIADLNHYLYGNNPELRPREIRAAEIYRSDNRGATWRRTHSEAIPEFTYNFGYYFGAVCVDPKNPEALFVMGVPLLKSEDGGKTFSNSMKPGVHVDHHAIWIDPQANGQVLLGNDGGIYRSNDGGKNWRGLNWQNVGQFYTLAYDMAKPYRIYGGLQDNGVWRGPSKEQGTYDKAWTPVSGNDGTCVQVDFRDNETVYSGAQFGQYKRQNMATHESLSIYPRHKLKEEPYRYNWITPFVLSRHQQDILYMAAQKVLRSLDKGESWSEISPDLSENPEQRGDVPFGTVTVLAESPQKFGKLYAGTDNGRLWVSEGGAWQRMDQGLASDLWISGIELSRHAEGTLFVTQTGYRNDHFEAYVFMSRDDGKSWESLRSNLPAEACNVIRQDLIRPEYLYLGTDVGLWFSQDTGKSWRPYQAGLPQVPVYAMEIQPREQELIVATHGRSIFVLNLKPLQQLKPEWMTQELAIMPFEDPTFSRDWGERPWSWDYSGEKPEALEIWFWQKRAERAEISIYRDKQLVRQISLSGDAGLNPLDWDFQVTPEPSKKKKNPIAWHIGQTTKLFATPGKYLIRVEVGKSSAEKEFEIKKSEP